jgi:hypothetical protein
MADFSEPAAEIAEYCRQIETYLCRKNGGHLIRVVGPSFEVVSRWAFQGVPLKIAMRGIDRYFERYDRSGSRRRAVRIDFCEADVLDTFDEWRRALGLGLHAGTAGQAQPGHPRAAKGAPSLAEHLERVVLKLSGARAAGTLADEADWLIDRVVAELDEARTAARGLRGEARRALLERLGALDRELLQIVAASLADPQRRALDDEAELELAAYRATMDADAWQRAHGLAVERLVRERFNLPTLTYS